MSFNIGRTASSWIIEGKILLKDFGTAVVADDVWSGNFCRKRQLFSSWTGQRVFNWPQMFGKLKFSTNAGVDYSLRKIDRNQLSAVIRNNSNATMKSMISMVNEGKRTVNKLIISSGQEALLSLKNKQNKLQGISALKIVCDEQIICAKSAQFPIPPELTIVPERYYFPNKTDKTTIKIKNVEPETAKLEIVLSANPGSTPLRKLTLSPATKIFSLNVAKLPPGRYVLKISSKDMGERVTGEDYRTIFLGYNINGLSPLPVKQTYSLNGKEFMLNGKLFFPLMGSGTPAKNRSPLAKNCFNVRYGPMGVCQNAPLSSNYGLPLATKKNNMVYFCLDDEKKVFAGLKKNAEGKAGKPILFNQLRYEAQFPLFRKTPEGLKELSQPDEYAKMYRYLKKIKPEALISIHTDRPLEAGSYAPAGDIVEISSYSSSYAPGNMLNSLEKEIRTVNLQIGEKPLIWWLGGSIPSPAPEQPKKLEAQLY